MVCTINDLSLSFECNFSLAVGAHAAVIIIFYVDISATDTLQSFIQSRFMSKYLHMLHIS